MGLGKENDWRRKWQPTPVLLPGKFHGQRSLVGYSPWGGIESDTMSMHMRMCAHTHTHTQVRSWASQVALEVKNQSASAGEVRETGSIPQSGRSPGGHHGNPLQYSCLENPMDGEAWQAMVHRVAKSWTRLK